MARLNERTLLWVAGIVMAAALVYRLWPMVAGMPALAQFFVTEDGYLMLTVARNLAIGLGLSVSEGTIPTNGVQPLATFLYAIPYALTGGDKVASLYGVHLIMVAAAVAGVFAVRAFAARVLAPQGAAPVWPWLVAALWFAGPLLVNHSMNALETGLYTVLVLLALLQFGRVLARGAEAGQGDLLLAGFLFGLAFLGRVDAVFLIFAALFVWIVHALTVQGLGLGALARRLVGPALVCALVVAPWLIHNQVNFGSIVPISGTAQSMSAGLGQNLPLLPAVLFEHMLPMLPVPGSLQTNPAVMAATGGVFMAILLAFLVQCWRRGGTVRLVVLTYVLFGVGLAVYYGLFFGAAHFLSRYHAPLAPLLITASVSVLLDLTRWLVPARAGAVLSGLGITALLLAAALNARLLLPGAKDQGHFQVVGWVSGNVPDDVWVGAVQTGTLGYWHDRTVNLDGKVNPEALAARRDRGDVLDYVAASGIDYLADWYGIADWVNRRDFGQTFEAVVADSAANLGVLRRRALPE
jgi:hypothetical protein